MNIAADVGVGAVVVGTTVAASYVNVTVPYLGVPVNVVVAAIGGAIAGFAWATKEESRKEMWKVAMASVIAACAATALLPLIVPKLESGYLAPVAALVALFGRKWVPAVFDRIDVLLDAIPFLRKKS